MIKNILYLFRESKKRALEDHWTSMYGKKNINGEGEEGKNHSEE
jgi:hypothetical protein